jgi:hypothetical protein
MKTILIVFALVLTLSLTGSASNVSSVTKSQTENLAVSKSNASSNTKAAKSKKAYKHHKKASGSKNKK